MFDNGFLSLNTLKIMKTDSISKFNNEVEFRNVVLILLIFYFQRRNMKDL